MIVNRQPLPDWTRPGETWRIEHEPLAGVAPGGVCASRTRVERCYRKSVAVVGRSGRPICERHLRAIGMWIEGGRVVSWCLRP